jgi:ribonuclease BN (tRNA processing enzyme)
VKLQLLPTTFNENGCASAQQHTCCFVIDDCVAIDAGSLATSTNKTQKAKIRDIILSHAHLDHIAGLPIFIDDLFANLEKPIRIHATVEVIKALKDHIFNWVIYPDFSELKNENGKILVYQSFTTQDDIKIAHLNVKAIEVNHKVPSVGLIFSDGNTKVALSGDTSEMSEFWEIVNAEKNLDILLIECAFPNEFNDLAHTSHHLTPNLLKKELEKFNVKNCPIYIVNLKPMYREQIVAELCSLKIENLNILEVGKVYEF